ncbi:MAG: hypothetical protein Q9225_003331 [Loekoesia sp. 1 TL-2023]
MNDRDNPHDVHRAPSGQVLHPDSALPTSGSATSSTVAPSSERTSPSQQARRLQLRNACFRGQALPIRRISPILSSSILSPEPFTRTITNENSPHNVEKRQLYGEDLPRNPVNILQELHNSARRKRHSARPSIGEIFQDDTATTIGDGDCGLSWYSETSNNNSPLQPENSLLATMKPREISFNGGTPPPLSSPLTKQARARKGNRAHQRSTSAEATKYIEYLESQLVAVNAKLDSLLSPTSHKTRSAKLRALTSEARSLRQQLSEWEQKFDEKVKDERNQLAEVEMSLTGRLQALEDEVEAKDNKVRDLEWELGNLKSRVKDAEGLEMVNADLERRIDLLTNLLVQSPTKLELCSATTSPSKPDPQRPATRPRSMVPRVPPSPGSMRLSLSIGGDARFRRSRRSIASASSTSISPGNEQYQVTEGMKESKDSSELGSSNSSLFRSPTSSSSRPTSLHSSGSFGAYSWGLPFPPEPENQAKAGYKQRRMRRFPPGAASLKPLILPTAAGTPSLPVSAPVRDTFQDSSQDSSKRDFSNISLDPTVAFLSKGDFSSPVTTPTQPGRKRSAPYAHTEPSYALEGCSSSSIDQCDNHSVLSPRSFSDEPLETVEEESFDVKLSERERPRSLGEELEEAELLFGNSFDDGLIPDLDQGRGQDAIAKFGQNGIDAPQSNIPDPSMVAVNVRKSGTIPRAQTTPVKLATQSPSSCTSTTTSTPHMYGLFSRLKNLMLRTKQDLPALAQRLIHNAWVIGMAKLGGLGWWLLGLVYRCRWRKNKGAADAETTVEEVPSRGMEWHYFSPGSNERRGSRRHGQPSYSINDREIAKAPAWSLSSGQPKSLQGTSKDPPAVRHGPHLIPCPDCQEPSSRRAFRLWFRFSLAIVLAVGIAIKDGPGTLLEEYHESNGKLFDNWQLIPRNVRCVPGGAAQKGHGGS